MFLIPDLIECLGGMLYPWRLLERDKKEYVCSQVRVHSYLPGEMANHARITPRCPAASSHS
jgi:hypothetical protein